MALIRILLVDDDELIRVTLCEVLDQNGFAVTTAAYVSEALKHISSRTFEVLLSDLHMPGAGDGLTVCKCDASRKSQGRHHTLERLSVPLRS